MPLVLGSLVLAGITASLVTADGSYAHLLGRATWRLVWLDELPYRATALLVAAMLVLLPTVLAVGRLGDVRLLFCVVLPLATQVSGFRLGPFDSLDVTVLLVLGVWLGLHLGGHPDFAEVRLGPVVLAGLFLCVLQIPYIVMQSPVRWLVGLLGLFKVVIIPFLMVNFLTNRRLLDFWATALRRTALLSAIAAIVQFALAYFGIFTFTLVGTIEEAYKPTPIGFVLRASAFAPTAQHLAAYLLLALPFWLMTWSRSPGLVRLLPTAAILVILVGLTLTWNLSAILAVGFVVGLFPLVRWPEHGLHFALLYGMLLIVSYYTGLLEFLWDETLGDAGVAKGADQRMTLLSIGLEKLWRDPFWGVGIREMAEFSGNFWSRPVHNAYLQAYTELGLPGFVLFTGLVLIATTGLFLQASRSSATARDLPAAAGIGLVGYLVVILNEPNVDNSNTWLALGLAAAIQTVAARPCWLGRRAT